MLALSRVSDPTAVMARGAFWMVVSRFSATTTTSASALSAAVAAAVATAVCACAAPAAAMTATETLASAANLRRANLFSITSIP